MIRWCKYMTQHKTIYADGLLNVSAQSHDKVMEEPYVHLNHNQGCHVSNCDFFSISPPSFPLSAHEPLLTLKLMSSEPFFSQVPNVLNLEFVTFS